MIIRVCPICRGEGFTDVTIGSIGAEADLCCACNGAGKTEVPLKQWIHEISERERAAEESS